MILRHKIKHRTLLHDNLPDGWYIYSRRMPDCANGRKGFRRIRLEGPFGTRIIAATRARVKVRKLKKFVRYTKKKREKKTK